MVKDVQISPAIVHYFAIFFSKNDHDIELVVLHTINPVKSTKWVTTFSWIFHFPLIGFLKKIFFFTNARCSGGMWNYVQGQKRRKFIFWGYLVYAPVASYTPL